jgi:hypothetical protein
LFNIKNLIFFKGTYETVRDALAVNKAKSSCILPPNDEDDDVFEVDQEETQKNKKTSSLSSRSSKRSSSGSASDVGDYSMDEEEESESSILKTKGKRRRGRPSTTKSKVISVSSVSSLEDYGVSRKDGKKLKKLEKHKDKKRQRLVSSLDEESQSTEKDTKKRGRGRPKKSNVVKAKKSIKNKTAFKSKLDLSESSSSLNTSLSETENFADEIHSTNRGFQGSADSRPIKALKCSLESKLSRQESRITAVENIMQESTDMYGGKNLNDLFAPSAQRLAIKLAIAVKGESLKDSVLTENGAESANSDKTPWSSTELAVFKRVMMRKCKLNSEQFSKKFSSYRTAVNSRSRYEYRLHLKSLGIKPNSKQARMYSRSKKHHNHSSSDDDLTDIPIVKKSVKFSSQLTQDIPTADFVESIDETQLVTPSPLVISSRFGQSSNKSAAAGSEPISGSNLLSAKTSSFFELNESTASNSNSKSNSILKPNKNVSITNMPISESKPDQPVLTSVQTSSLQQSSIFTAPTVAPAVHACKTNSITNYFKVASKTTFSPSGNSSLTITKKKQNNNES